LSVQLLTTEFDDYGSEDGFMSVMIALLFFGTVYALEKIGSGKLFKTMIRGIIGDYAYL